jgi:hypothetical protein
MVVIKNKQGKATTQYDASTQNDTQTQSKHTLYTPIGGRRSSKKAGRTSGQRARGVPAERVVAPESNTFCNGTSSCSVEQGFIGVK